MARAGLETLLSRVEDIEVTAAAASADVAVVFAKDMEDDGLLELGGVPVIALLEDADGVRDALRGGIRGVLAVSASVEDLAAAIRAVAAGLIVLPPEFAQHMLAAAPSRGSGKLVEALTHRELEVLRLLGRGSSNKEIAARLAISEHTAKFHVASVMSKLGAGSRTEAVTEGLRQGLILL